MTRHREDQPGSEETIPFSYDVFLSHSTLDKSVVRELAERLKGDGLRVWFDEWEIKLGDSIPSKVEAALEQSRVLILCMSEHAFASDWSTLENQTFRFRDPLNKQRRFIPLRLDDAPAPGSLPQFLYADWRGTERDTAYPKLLEACRPIKRRTNVELTPNQQALEAKILSLGHTSTVRSVAFNPNGTLALSGSYDNTVRLWDVESGRCLRVLEGHTNSVWSVAWSADGSRALSGSEDKTVRLWDVESGRCLRVLEGHTAGVNSVAWNADGREALSGSQDKMIRLWDVESGHCLRVLEGHISGVNSVAWSADGRRALSGSQDSKVRLWDIESGHCLRVLRGHTSRVWSVAWSADGRRALSASQDKTVRLWDVESGDCLHVLEGHTAGVNSVTWSADGRRALSASQDKTVRLWDVESGHCLHVLEGHTGSVLSVAWSNDGRRAMSGSQDKTVRLWNVESGRSLHVFEGHTGSVLSVAWSNDGRRAMSGSKDKTIRLWDVESGHCLRVLEGHTARVWNMAWSADGCRVLSGSEDNTVRLWDVESGHCLRVFEGHMSSVWSVAWSADGRQALSGSEDTTVRLWDVESGRSLRVLEGHTLSVLSVAWSTDGRRVLSGSEDTTVRLWDVESGRSLRVLEGHTGSVWNVAWSADGRRALSSSVDQTVRLWDIESGRCLRVLEGHTSNVRSIEWSADGRLALSASVDQTLRLWDVESGRCLRVLEGHSASVRSVAFSTDGRFAYSSAVNGVMRVWDLNDARRSHGRQTVGEGTAEIQPPRSGDRGYEEERRSDDDQLQYTNAKVLLVGDSAAGKTGLSKRLALNDWKESDSTIGAWATQWPLPVVSDDGVEREIWLWDFGGQADQRLIHQLYMDQTALAVLVFDGGKDNLFETLGQWDRDLSKASVRPFQKLLVAGRVDASVVRVDRVQLQKFAASRGFRGDVLETSAKAGTGCELLKQAIYDAIPWAEIECRTTLTIFKRLKDEIVRLRDEGRVLMRFNELRDALTLKLPHDSRFTDDQLSAVVTLLSGPGIVWKLDFGSWVLLQPERINACAQAVIQTMSDDPHGLGCISEERVLNGELKYGPDVTLLPADEERIVRMAMHATLIDRNLCWREAGENLKTMLVFPSYYRREREELTRDPAVFVSYRFHGFLDDIYATLVVRLHHTDAFEKAQLWHYAADFKTQTGQLLGVKLTRRSEGSGELAVYFDPTIPIGEKLLFARFIHEHLKSKVREPDEIERLRHYVCPHCHTPVGNREVAMKRLADGKKNILCVNCEKRVPLWDELEDRFASDALREAVRREAAKIDFAKSNESKERALVGEVISAVALAGQIAREFNVSDKGLDMEIEFNDDAGDATGKRLYLQLKSGDSHLKPRQRDDAEVFQIKDQRYVKLWMEQPFPVLLVVRNSVGEVRWMEIRDWLRTATNNGQKEVTQIVFDGERFDVMSIRRWRDQLLGRSVPPTTDG